MIEHQAALNTVLDVNRRFHVSPADRVLGLSSLSFDLSVYDIFGLLGAGGAVVLPEAGQERDPAAWRALLRGAGVTVWNTVPALAEMLAEALEALGERLPASLRLVLMSGDWIPIDLPDRLRALAPGEIEIVSLGGATEAAIWSILHPVGEVDPSSPSIPYGRPMERQSVHVLDEALEPCPVGVSGELFIGGVGVARGYLGEPEKTAASFLTAPADLPESPGRPVPGERLYRTGDLGRFLEDGATIEFLGRRDFQVKIRGYRIELGEIEVALARHPAVRSALAVARGQNLDRYLAAYVVLDPAFPEDPVSPEDLRRFLEDRLPAYMVPEACVLLEALPLTANGKVDRDALPSPRDMPSPRDLNAPREPAEVTGAALPAPDTAPRDTAPRDTAPRNPVERRLRELFTQVLREAVEAPIGIHDDFFSLGGNSVTAVRLVSRARAAFGLELPLRTFFDHPTVAGLAERLGGHAQEAPDRPPLRAEPPSPEGPLSFAQERLWFLARLDPADPTWNLSQAVRRRGPLDFAALDAALREVVRRHDSLRTSFLERDGEPRARLSDDSEVPLRTIDLTALAGRRPLTGRRVANQLLAAEAARPFHLERGPLLRVTVVRLAAEEHLLLAVTHHIISDGISMLLFQDELTAAYEAFWKRRAPRLVPLPVQYGDYARWQRRWLRGDALAAQIAYWRERLSDAPAGLDLPTDLPRPPVLTHRGERLQASLDEELTGRIEALGRSQGATLFMTLLAAFKALLGRLAGCDDVAVGTPIEGRGEREVEPLIGLFLNTLVLRTDLSGQPSFRELLGRVRETALGAYAHQDVPFEKLLAELRPARDRSRTSWFQVFFNMLEGSARESAAPAVGRSEDLSRAEEEVVTTAGTFAKFDLTVYALRAADGVRLSLVYNVDLFAEGRMNELLVQYRYFLEQAVALPDTPVAAYSLLTPRSADLLPDPSEPLDAAFREPAHALFLRRAAHTPDRAAVAAPGRVLTYGGLELESARVAARLIAEGVARGDVVAVLAWRGAPLVAAILGVLRTGAAFAVLDPGYPAARLAELLRLARPRAVLRTTRDAWRIEETGARTLPSTPSRHQTPHPRGPETGRGIGADDLAVLTFTSGSTGTPKGVLGRHGPLTHFLPWQAERFGLGPDDRVGVLSGLAHDPLQRDLLTPLCLGATAVVPDPARRLEPGDLAAWLAATGVSVTHLTPALGQVLCEAGSATTLPALRRAFFVGEALSRNDVDRLRRLAPNLEIIHLYGTTETQRAVSYHVAGEGSSPVLSLGRGMPGCQLLVLGTRGGLTGVGELGELHFQSPHLARGYLRDPALTARRFLPDPFSLTAGQRLYRTGDLGRFLGNGEVTFAGRADHQLQIRGYRVEPGEVEAALLRTPGVVRAAVVEGRRQALAAFVVVDEGLPAARAAAPEALRQRLAAVLPAYLVPASVEIRESLPLAPVGKVDRSALRALARRAAESSAPEPPRTAAERRVADIFAELLGVSQVGREADFFELGGHSLLAVRLLARLRRELGVELGLGTLFEASTVARLAARGSGQAARGSSQAASGPSWSPLVEIRPATGDGAPFFCVHPAGGTVLCYAELARRLDLPGAFYGLEAPGLAADQRPATSIAELAGLYLDALRQVRPAGPYRLGGWSMGGMVAWEMACRLREAGEEVALLALFDAGPVMSGRAVDEGSLFAANSALLAELGFSEEESAALGAMTAEERRARMWRRSRDREILPPEVGPEEMQRFLDLLLAHGRALRTYRPRAFSGPSVLFAAAERTPARLGDPADLGWSELGAEVERIFVPGDHRTMLAEPHVAVLADRLRLFLVASENRGASVDLAR